MRYSRTFLILLLIAGTAGSLRAQAPKKVTFGGAGRLLIDNARLGGDLLDTDTTTARRELGGSALFDLGITIRPDENTEIKAVTRVQNDIDGFWGAGIIFQLRELTAKGVIANSVRYGIGDIDVALTPYTLWNDGPEFRYGNTPAFDVFRDITDYENFYADSSWRQQGVEAEWGLAFDRGIERLTFRGMIAKNRQTDFFTLPDRLMSLGQIGLEVNPGLRFHLNATNMFEVARSAQFNTAETAHRVISLDGTTGWTLDNGMDLRIDGEAGASSVTYTDVPEAPDENMEDFFVDVRGALSFPNCNIDLLVGYADVGPDFRSPGAQSRRLNPNAPADLFSFITNRESQRPLNIRDVIQDPLVYNRTLTTDLQAFNPGWDNVRPYGRATPNRRGVDLSLQYKGDTAGRFEAGLQAAYLTEIAGEGTANLRSFIDLRANGAVHLAPVLGWNKLFDVHLGIRFQQTSRDGTEGVDMVDLSSMALEGGITWEVYKRLDVLAGLMLFTANGNEFIADRDDFTSIDFYSAYQTDANELFLTGGFRYRFTESISLSAQYQFLDRQDGLIPENSFTIGNALLLYNMFF